MNFNSLKNLILNFKNSDKDNQDDKETKDKSKKYEIINENELRLTLKYELFLRPDLLGPNLNENIQNELSKFLHKAHGIFYIKDIQSVSNLLFPLIYLNDGKFKLELKLLSEVYFVNVGDVLALTIYINDNEIFGENAYVMCKINKNDYQQVSINEVNAKTEIIIIKDKKPNKIYTKQNYNIKVTKLLNSTNLDKIYVHGQFIF